MSTVPFTIRGKPAPRWSVDFEGRPIVENTMDERLRAMAWRARATVRERRMPPDFALDPDGVATFTSWFDGAMPP